MRSQIQQGIMSVFVLPTLHKLNTFGPHFTAYTGKRVTHFIFLHHFGGSHYRVMYICKYEKMPRMSVSVVLYE